MKVNLRWLKVINYTNLVLVTLLLIPSTISIGKDLSNGRSVPPGLAGDVALGFLVTHTILILYIQKRYYPNKEISKTLRKWMTVFTVICSIIVAFIIIAATSFATNLIGSDLDRDEFLVDSFAITWSTLTSIFFLLQIVIGNRLITVIQLNFVANQKTLLH